jgi:hypothetical protein
VIVKRALVLALVFGLLFGCGPIGYIVEINGAAQAVEGARAVNAARLAPYEYHYAAEHLDKAREFAAEAEYQNAMDMAAVAEEYGNRARELARRRQQESGR